MKTLAEAERDLAKTLGPSARAKRLAPKLGEIAEEMNATAVSLAAGHRPVATPAAAEIMDLSAELVDQARDLLRILEQEQFRQRTAIQMFLQGQVDREFLRKVAYSWNGDPT